MRNAIASFLVFVAMLTSFELTGEAAGIDHAGLARQVIETHVRPLARSFTEAATALSPAIDLLCVEPSAEHLAQARQRFAVAALSFARLQHLRFGPLHEKSRSERLLLYPDPKGLVRRQVEKAFAAADQTLLSADRLYGKSVALQGFSALELLLFGDAAQQTTSTGDQGRLRCGYARAIAANIARIAAEFDKAWQDPRGYSALMLVPGAENPAYLEPKEVTLDIIKAFLDGLERARDLELAAPLGLRVQGQAPTSGVLETSGLSLPYLTAGLEGLLQLYREGGLQALAASNDNLLAAEVGREIESAIQSAKAVTVTLAEARTEPTEKRKLIAMGFPLRNAADLARDTLAAATGLSLGFRAGDGD
jgi:hypothetical protein